VSVTVVVADDQPLMRAALRTCLEAEPDITVVGEAGNGAEAVRLAGTLRPAVVVMDVRMPVMDGLEAARRITAVHGADGPKVLVMTTFDLDEYIIDALRAGASGFLIKDAPPEDLVRAVRVLHEGEALLAPSITRRLLDLRARTLPRVAEEDRRTALAGITARELEVLKLVARGLSNQDIARALDLAHSSVKTHVGHLLSKLGATDRVHLVVFAYEHELVRPGANGSDPADGAPGRRAGSGPPLRVPLR
jgi:DNA-binding NarL/FixJ family response regulator